MSEVFLGINEAGQVYVDATLDASITWSFISHTKYITNVYKESKALHAFIILKDGVRKSSFTL